MSDLSNVPLRELQNDLAAARLNVDVTKRLMAAGTTQLWGQSPQMIIATDELVIEIIETELRRRALAEDDQ